MYMISRPFSPLFSDPWGRESSHVPAMHVDVEQRDNGYLLKADLPGVEKQDIHLSVEDGRLTISADLNAEKQENQQGFLYNERRYGHVERSFQLEGIDEKAITATYRNGVLMLNLPKEAPEERKSRHEIAIAEEE